MSISILCKGCGEPISSHESRKEYSKCKGDDQ